MGASVTRYHTEKGIQIVERERAEVVAERDAFDEFLSRISDLTPVGQTQPRDTTGTVVQTLGHTGGARDDCRRALDAYRETVMAVPHYQDRYGEPVTENLRVEFGSELATFLTNRKQLTQVVHSTLRQEADRARKRRSEFLDLLDAEQDDLEGALATITDLQQAIEEFNSEPVSTRSISSLQDWYNRFTTLQERCDTVAAERQDTFRHRSRRELPFIDAEQLATYLYRSLPVDHPVLADVVDLTRLIRTNRSHVERKLISR